MIAHLSGVLVAKSPTHAVVEVAGVGYGLSVSLLTSEQLPSPEAPVRLFTYLHVRDDRLELYGFAAAEERDLFELLIEVPGIGPRSAQTILSGIPLRELQEAICQGRAGELTAVKGIGRKTAERIIVDLQDKVRLAVSRGSGLAAASGAPGSAMADEAVLALVALGIGSGAARQAVGRLLTRKEPVKSVQELVKLALKER
ncbi:MAG: Holliday junction branch migration protein RuvA [Candidatus Latescibacterota bacterium]